MLKKLSILFLAGVVLLGLTACDPFDIIKDWGIALKDLATGSETDGDEMQFDEDGNLIIEADAEGLNWDPVGDDWSETVADFDEAMAAIEAAQAEQEAAAQAEEEEIDLANYKVTTEESGGPNDYSDLADYYGEKIEIDEEEEELDEDWEPPIFESGTYGLIGHMYIESSGNSAFDSYMRCLDGVNRKYVHHYDYCDATWGPFDDEFDNIFLGEMLECMNSDPDFREDADNCWLDYRGEWGVGINDF